MATGENICNSRFSSTILGENICKKTDVENMKLLFSKRSQFSSNFLSYIRILDHLQLISMIFLFSVTMFCRALTR